MQNKIALENLSKENSVQNSFRETARSTEKGTKSTMTQQVYKQNRNERNRVYLGTAPEIQKRNRFL